jgi:hypothetical protein
MPLYFLMKAVLYNSISEMHAKGRVPFDFIGNLLELINFLEMV